jgi:hypothetical protein
MFTRRALPLYAIPGYGLPEYAIPSGFVAPIIGSAVEYTAMDMRPHYKQIDNRPHYTAPNHRMHYKQVEDM